MIWEQGCSRKGVTLEVQPNFFSTANLLRLLLIEIDIMKYQIFI